MEAILVVFHMKGCPHCPRVLKLCRNISGIDRVEVESAHPLCDDAGVRAFPSVVLALPHVAYEAERSVATPEELLSWIQSKL